MINKVLWRESPTQAWIDLEAQIIYRRGRDEKDHATKRRPLCKLPPRLVAHLKRWRAADQKREAEAKARERDLKINAVIHHPNGVPFAGRVRTGFESIVRDAGLDGKITPHWMRHTAATWMMEGGVDVWQAAGYLGMTPSTLEKHYGHHRTTHQSAARSVHSRR